ncbi:uncharacterized protein CEXT_694031 [Caerostris extrusa]|uniref:Ig-like domain-containing protein n=1 Tax=Caerostris extrusa TaxID=172846 RepID=A0AAV4M3T0_CAEEX|nr:uncharacterized protein CEXT_694031 [Caerostris extrusa]
MKISRTSRVVVPQMVQLCSTEQCLRFCTPQCKHRIETAAIRCRGRHRRERRKRRRWMKDEMGNLSVIKEDERVGLLQGRWSSGGWCRRTPGSTSASCATASERRGLRVLSPSQVTVLPQYQVLSTGEEATFRCNVTGYPVHTMAWLKDQRPIVATDRVQFSSRDVLHIASLRREDRGMYQCFVYNDNGGAQGTVELKISDVPPSIVSAFSEQTLEPGRWCP